MFKIILLLVMVGFYLPYHTAQAQFQTQFYDNPKPLFEASGNISVGSYYVHAIPQIVPGYNVKVEYGVLFFHGQPPFDLSTGLFMEERRPYDPRLTTRISLYYAGTSGRAVNRDTSLARTVGAEEYFGIGYRQRLFRNLIASELDVRSETGRGTSHGGTKASFGIRFRFLTFENTKFYIARFVEYGDKAYINQWFDTRATTDVDNIELRKGLYEVQDRLTIASDLKHRLFLEVDFRRGTLLNTPKNSLASITTRDNSFLAAIGYRY